MNFKTRDELMELREIFDTISRDIPTVIKYKFLNIPQRNTNSKY